MTSEGKTIKRPEIHLLLTGETGVGKDTFAATFPKPMLVWHLDGYGQEIPYFKGAKNVSELMEYQIWNVVIPYRDVEREDGMVRVEYYSSDDPRSPHVANVLESRMSLFQQEKKFWKTLVCGSLSSAALEGRLYEQFVLNPQFKDSRKWYGAATEYVERLVVMQKALPINVVFITHIGRDKDEVNGEFIFTPDLPGRLSYGAARYFNEMYRLFVKRDEHGKQVRWLQTDNDGRYQAKTHVDAPGVVGPSPTYEDLWVNWRGWGSGGA